MMTLNLLLLLLLRIDSFILLLRIDIHFELLILQSRHNVHDSFYIDN